MFTLFYPVSRILLSLIYPSVHKVGRSHYNNTWAWGCLPGPSAHPGMRPVGLASNIFGNQPQVGGDVATSQSSWNCPSQRVSHGLITHENVEKLGVALCFFLLACFLSPVYLGLTQNQGICSHCREFGPGHTGTFSHGHLSQMQLSTLKQESQTRLGLDKCPLGIPCT